MAVFTFLLLHRDVCYTVFDKIAPDSRRGYRSQIVPRYQRRQETVNKLIGQAFLRDISTATWARCSPGSLGEAVSHKPSPISLASWVLPWPSSTAASRQMNYLYLFFDVVVFKIRDPRRPCAAAWFWCLVAKLPQH